MWSFFLSRPACLFTPWLLFFFLSFFSWLVSLAHMAFREEGERDGGREVRREGRREDQGLGSF